MKPPLHSQLSPKGDPYWLFSFHIKESTNRRKSSGWCRALCQAPGVDDHGHDDHGQDDLGSCDRPSMALEASDEFLLKPGLRAHAKASLQRAYK